MFPVFSPDERPFFDFLFQNRATVKKEILREATAHLQHRYSENENQKNKYTSHFFLSQLCDFPDDDGHLLSYNCAFTYDHHHEIHTGRPYQPREKKPRHIEQAKTTIYDEDIVRVLNNDDVILSFEGFCRLLATDYESVLQDIMERNCLHCLNRDVTKPIQKSDIVNYIGKYSNSETFEHHTHTDFYMVRKNTDFRSGDRNKAIVKRIFERCGFPYKPTKKEYIRFLETTNKHIKFPEKYINNFDFMSKHPRYSVKASNVYQWFFPQTRINKKTLLQHAHIVGGSGSGKSELLKNIIYTMRKEQTGCVLLDPHGELADTFDRVENTIKIEPLIKRFVVNPFDIQDKSLKNRHLVAEEIQQILKEMIQDTGLSSLMGTVIYPIIMTLLKLPYADFKMLSDCLDVHQGEKYIKWLEPLVDEHLETIWGRILSDIYETSKNSIYNRLQSFLNKKIILDSVCGLDDFNRVIEHVVQGKTLVVSIPSTDMGVISSEVFGRFLMCRMQIWAKRRKAIPEHQRKPVLLIVDECQNFVSADTAKTLDQFGRKFKLFMILAHQHIAQIEDRGLKGAITASCQNKIIGKANEQTRRTLSGDMGLSIDALDGLQQGHFYAKFFTSEPLKFYNNLYQHKATIPRIQYADSDNRGYVDGWQIVDFAENAKPHNPTKNRDSGKNTASVTPKFEL